MFVYSPLKMFDMVYSITGTTFTDTTAVQLNLEYAQYGPDGGVSVRTRTITFTPTAGATTTSIQTLTADYPWVQILNVTFLAVGVTGTTYTSPTLNVSVQYGGNTSMWLPETYSAPIEWPTSTEPYLACRVNASQLTIYNTTANLNREGTAQVTRLQSEKVQPWHAVASDVNHAPPSLRYVAPLERGVETFSLPPFSNVSFLDCARLTLSETPFPTFDLTMAYQYSLVALTDPTTATNTTLSLTYHEHREFCASSQLFAVGVSKLSLDQVLKTLQMVALMPPARPANAPSTISFSGMPVRVGRVTPPRRNTVQRAPPPPPASKQRRANRRGALKKARGSPAPVAPPARQKMASGLSMYLASRKGGKGTTSGPGEKKRTGGYR
jgi:hypothetical protein